MPIVNYGSPPIGIRSYLLATRGIGVNSTTTNVAGFLPDFFARAIHHLSWLGFETDQARLTIVRSPVADIETINKAHIIFDETYYEYSACATSAHLLLSDRKDERESQDDEFYFYPFALCASRYLAMGSRQHAAHNMHLLYQHVDKLPKPRKDAHRQRVRYYSDIQAAFAVAHELAHCSVASSGRSVSEHFAAEYFSNISPILAQAEAVREKICNNTNFAPPSLQVSSTWTEGTQSYARQIDEQLTNAAEGPIFRSNGLVFSLRRELQQAIQPINSLGEEIICDALAAAITAKYFEHRPAVGLKEAIIGCALGRYITRLTKALDETIKPPHTWNPVSPERWEAAVGEWTRSTVFKYYLGAIYQQIEELSHDRGRTKKSPPSDGDVRSLLNSLEAMELTTFLMLDKCAEIASDAYYNAPALDEDVPDHQEFLTYLASRHLDIDVQKLLLWSLVS